MLQGRSRRGPDRFELVAGQLHVPECALPLPPVTFCHGSGVSTVGSQRDFCEEVAMSPSHNCRRRWHAGAFLPGALGSRSALQRVMRRGWRILRGKQPYIAGLSVLLSACGSATAPEDQLTATLTLTPVVLNQPSTATVVVAVTNHGDREIVIGGGPTGCLLSFEVLDDSGVSVSRRPDLSRLCATDINGEMTVAAGSTYEETMGWAGLVRQDGQDGPLAAGTYGIRTLLGVVDHGLITLPPVVEVEVVVESTGG